MNRLSYKAQILEDRFAIAILLTLYNYDEPIIKSVLTSLLSSGSRTIADRIPQLESAGIIIESQEDVRPFRKYISLTPKGKIIAEYLVQIENLLD